MLQANAARPVIVLLDARPTADNRFIKRWLQKSRFVTCESTDICDAIVELSDFTTPHRPDVVLLECESPATDIDLVRRLSASGGFEPTVVAMLADGTHVDNISLAQLQTRLERIIPAPAPRTDSVAA